MKKKLTEKNRVGLSVSFFLGKRKTDFKKSVFGCEKPKKKRPKKLSFGFRFTTLPVLRRPQKNVISPIFCTNLRLEASLPVYFSCTTFRRCATTSATPLIPKCTTRRWTLRCSHYSVAKRQVFSCPLRTATMSPKFENMAPGR